MPRRPNGRVGCRHSGSLVRERTNQPAPLRLRPARGSSGAGRCRKATDRCCREPRSPGYRPSNSLFAAGAIFEPVVAERASARAKRSRSAGALGRAKESRRNFDATASLVGNALAQRSGGKRAPGGSSSLGGSSCQLDYFQSAPPAGSGSDRIPLCPDVQRRPGRVPPQPGSDPHPAG